MGYMVYILIYIYIYIYIDRMQANAEEHISYKCIVFCHFILQLVSWLFPSFSRSSLHRGLMAVFPLSFTPVISCWLCALSDKTGRTALFSGCISRRVSHCVYANVFRSLFLLLTSHRGRMHILPAYLPVLVHLKMRVSVQTVSESVMDRGVNNLAHHSGFCCSSKHEQNTVLWFPPSGWPAWQKTNMAALGWVEGKDSLKGVYL